MNHQWLAGIYDLCGKTGVNGTTFTIKDRDVRLTVNRYLNRVGIDTVLTPRLIRIVKRVHVHTLHGMILNNLSSEKKKAQMTNYVTRFRRKIYPEDWPTIVKLYEEGTPVASIAAEYDVTRQAIHYLLTEKDIISMVARGTQDE